MLSETRRVDCCEHVGPKTCGGAGAWLFGPGRRWDSSARPCPTALACGVGCSTHGKTRDEDQSAKRTDGSRSALCRPAVVGSLCDPVRIMEQRGNRRMHGMPGLKPAEGSEKRITALRWVQQEPDGASELGQRGRGGTSAKPRRRRTGSVGRLSMQSVWNI